MILGFDYLCLKFSQLKFNICVRCDMAFIEHMHRNNPMQCYLITSIIVVLMIMIIIFDNNDSNNNDND